jgi:hypothetical protein
MDSLKDLLGARGPKEPDEVAAIKRYISDEFGMTSTVGIQGNALIITVQSASLASTLRMRLPVIQNIVGTDKRLVFRIG